MAQGRGTTHTQGKGEGRARGRQSPCLPPAGAQAGRPYLRQDCKRQDSNHANEVLQFLMRKLSKSSRKAVGLLEFDPVPRKSRTAEKGLLVRRGRSGMSLQGTRFHPTRPSVTPLTILRLQCFAAHFLQTGKRISEKGSQTSHPRCTLVSGPGSDPQPL